MKLSDFDFDLPKNLIAHEPLEKRDHSKLMVIHRDSGEIIHDYFYNIGTHLPEKSVLVMNRSKVLPARLLFSDAPKEEILFLKPAENGLWECMVRGKKFKEGETLQRMSQSPDGSESPVTITIEKVLDGGTRLLSIEHKFSSIEELCEQQGSMPLPPYIETNKQHKDRYQTVVANETGSSAAPTAGLHFTPELLQSLEAEGHPLETVLLHVGLGTFQPVKVENIAEHQMHSEWFSIEEDTAYRLQQYRNYHFPITAVGTTSVRVLESSCERGQIKPKTEETDIFITPGYRFKCVDHLITNFHLPKSTLLMLVSAFAGKDLIMKAYNEAIAKEYRFFSFGDAMLIL